MDEVNRFEWHDSFIESTEASEFEVIRFIDQFVHPTYLRLIEAVLTPLVRRVAYFSRRDRGKGTDGLDVYSIAKELEGTELEHFVTNYHNVMRNGIAHGGILYRQAEIAYRDKKGNEESFTTNAIIQAVDELIDKCNGIVVALKVFCLTSQQSNVALPRQLLLEELREETRAPWWTVDGFVDSEVHHASQLMIYATPNSRHLDYIRWSAIKTGILAEYFAPGFERYFIAMKSNQSWPGWAAFDGDRIRDLRESNATTIEEYKGIIQDDIFYFVPKSIVPALPQKVATLVHALKIKIPEAMENSRDRMGIPRVVCRNATVHRNSWGAVVRGQVVVELSEGEVSQETIRMHKRRILRAAVSHARRMESFTFVNYLPVGFADISIYRRDYRRRKLRGFGLGDDLICTLQLRRISRIKIIDILGSTVERIGNWRIAWNKAWLQKCNLSIESKTEENQPP